VLLRFRNTLFLIAILGSCIQAPFSCYGSDRTRQPKIDFSRQVRPILAKHCYACHGPDKSESGLRLSEFATATQPSDSGAIAIQPNQPEHSELLVRIQSTDDSIRMPPEGDGLSPQNIAILRQWITEGGEFTTHWFFQPICKPVLPESTNLAWSKNAIDRYIHASLDQADLKPAEPASPRSLIRRLYYSMLGVPPTLEEIATFEADASDDAYERMVDRLIADPRMGERWARHWLDVVRYAETNSYERDGLKPFAWKYRDYVINAFNHDKPYDDFLTEQLAGDELDTVTLDSLTATGYYRLGVWDDEPADPLQAKFDGYDDLVTVTGQGMLGLTFNCARCHDHKIDPIPQKDYYQMVAFFRDVKPYGIRSDQKSANQIEISPPDVVLQHEAIDDELKSINDEMKKIEKAGIEKMKGEDQRTTEGEGRTKLLKKNLRNYLEDSQGDRYDTLESCKAELTVQQKKLPRRDYVLGLAESDSSPPETHLLLRGSPLAEGDVVAPGFPAMVKAPEPTFEGSVSLKRSAGRRKILADWITSDDNWFTARVIVNRLWQHHFGRGIVRSSNNFGQLGDAPTHPELLDWLASELIRHEWQLKPIHRAIVLSQAYRMSSQDDAKGMQVDAENNLFWKFPMRRLSAEELRDSVLATSGDLQFEKFGPSFYPEVADEVKATQSRPGAGWGTSSAADQSRRSIYIHIKRSLIPPELSVFDFPETDTSCEARFLTTQAAQSLGLLNGGFLQSQSKRFATRVHHLAGENRVEQVKLAIGWAYGRPATQSDLRRAIELMDRLHEKHQLDAQQQLNEYCLVLLNTNEFMYLD